MSPFFVVFSSPPLVISPLLNFRDRRARCVLKQQRHRAGRWRCALRKQAKRGQNPAAVSWEQQEHGHLRAARSCLHSESSELTLAQGLGDPAAPRCCRRQLPNMSTCVCGVAEAVTQKYERCLLVTSLNCQIKKQKEKQRGDDTQMSALVIIPTERQRALKLLYRSGIVSGEKCERMQGGNVRMRKKNE